MTTELGRLIRVDLRDIWVSEASDFTPWLGRPKNLAVLGETLGLELELEAQEQSVGPFRADLLCKDLNTDTWVLVENQLERTDHSHLGQLLTYASGLNAVVIIWIAAKFTEEHRSTLDWLNEITDERFGFFGLEVELWRIGDSLAAPKFNVVSQPNNWSRSVTRAARAIDDSQLSERKILLRRYWEGFHTVLAERGGPVSGNRKAQPRSWMTYNIGRTGFRLGAVAISTKRRIRAELYLSDEDAEAYYRLLESDREEIEAEIGYSLSWEELPSKRACRISRTLEDVDVGDESDWPRQHQWLLEKMSDFHRVFAPRVTELDADDWQMLE